MPDPKDYPDVPMFSRPTNSSPLGKNTTEIRVLVSVHEADAQCTMEVQRNPLVGFPVCMRAKGWQERRENCPWRKIHTVRVNA
jgi:hypothetical protein